MSQEQAQQLLYEMQMLEGHLTELQKRESSLMAVLRDAIATIESIKSIKGDKPINSLVPLGLGAFANVDLFYPRFNIIYCRVMFFFHYNSSSDVYN